MEILHLHLLDGTIYYNYHNFIHESAILAQVIKDVDILADMEDAWYNFLDSGQVWALLIGLFIGYAFKGLTHY